MISINEQQFEFKQNSSKSNRRPSPVARREDQLICPLNPDPKVVICANQKYGINLEQHHRKIQNFYEQKLLKESIKKAVISNFQRKKLIQENEFQIQRACQDATVEAKHYLDKVESWFGDSITRSAPLQEFQQFKKRKMAERAAKVNSIMSLIEKIATKLQDKKLDSLKKQFEQSLEAKRVKIPENKEYNKAVYKMKFIKEKVASNRRLLQSRMEERGQ